MRLTVEYQKTVRIPMGSIGEAIGLDEEQCQDARDTRDNLRSAFLPLSAIGTLLVLIPILSNFRSKSED